MKNLKIILIVSFLFLCIFIIFQYFNNSSQKKSEETKLVNLYYYNLEKDKELSGNPSCSDDFVLPVTRQLKISDNIIVDTINLLISGDLSETEKSEGFTTEFPNDGFRLISALQDSGNLTLTFEDKNNFSVGGSCRVGLLRSQIEKTVLQFENVKNVVIMPEELFQP